MTPPMHLSKLIKPDEATLLMAAAKKMLIFVTFEISGVCKAKGKKSSP